MDVNDLDIGVMDFDTKPMARVDLIDSRDQFIASEPTDLFDGFGDFMKDVF